jgi:hypothetical protein
VGGGTGEKARVVYLRNCGSGINESCFKRHFKLKTRSASTRWDCAFFVRSMLRRYWSVTLSWRPIIFREDSSPNSI